VEGRRGPEQRTSHFPYPLHLTISYSSSLVVISSRPAVFVYSTGEEGPRPFVLHLRGVRCSPFSSRWLYPFRARHLPCPRGGVPSRIRLYVLLFLLVVRRRLITPIFSPDILYSQHLNTGPILRPRVRRTPPRPQARQHLPHRHRPLQARRFRYGYVVAESRYACTVTWRGSRTSAWV